FRDLLRPANCPVNPARALDPHSKREMIETRIPESGLILRPNILYIGHTFESTGNKDTVPILEGRSSIGRLGVFIHVTAGFGDVGFGWMKHDGKGNQWTLELNVVHPVILYPMMEICQMQVEEVTQDFEAYSGRYSDQSGAQGTRFFQNNGCKV
ncbi:MAG: hypothetical protein LBB08_01945, partial [Rickettsiales bacterium]|nr:hypothetical protein [Rickettsiales bacterium]